MEKLKIKIAEAMTLKFVGEYCFSDDELSEIYSYAGKKLREFDFGYIDKISDLDYEVLFIAMVNSVKNWTSDEDRFWNRIAKTIVGTEECSPKIYNALTDVIDKLGTKNKIIYLNGAKKKYYATILAHSFSPLQSTESFVDLCWQIYCEDMAQNYFENDSIFELVSNELGKRFNQSKSDEDFQLGSQIYNFRAGIKRLAVEQSNLMTEYIRNTINAIDKLFNSQPIEKSYYYSLLFDWWRKKEANFGIEKQKISKVTKIISDYSSIKPRYINENGTVYIMVPAFRLLNNLDKCPWIEIYSNDTLVYSEELLTRGSGLAMNTKVYQIDVNKCLCGEAHDVRLVLTHNGTQIFDSKRSLERFFILFNGEREIFASECLPGNYQLYCRNLDFLLQYPENIKKTGSSFFIINAKEGDVLQSERRTILFAKEKQNKDIWIYADKKMGVKFRQGEEEYSVVDGELKIAAFASSDLSDFGVRYEDTSWRLQDFSKECRNGIVYHNISELLAVGEPQKINVFRFSSGKIMCSANVVKFNKVQILFDREFYYGKNIEGNVTFSTEKFDNETSFSIEQDEVSLPIADGEILLSVPKIRWKIDNGEWNHCFGEKGVWYKTINNSSILELDIPTSVSCDLLITPSCKLIEKDDNDLNRYKIGQEIYSQLGNYDGAMIFLSITGQEPLPILNVHTKAKFIDTPIFVFAQRHLLWSPATTYLGDEKDTFALKIHDRFGNIVKTFALNMKSSELNISDIEDDYYTVEVFLNSTSFFKKEELLYTQKIVVGDENLLRFKNKTIVINKVMLDNAVSSQFIKTIYIEKLRFIGSIDDCLYYSGYMYFRHSDGRKIYLNTMKNDYGTFDVTNPVRIELRSNCTCWMVAGLENDDIKDFLGELFLDHYNQLSNIAKGNKAINYYFYGIQEDNNV